ncbi:helix-turn-helix domain-containing protein [Paralimibaculum aggregatum]|uniref:Helix-turn-helix domain-containing protein n=1 Tax=Paralimibaculum aggregatum TaxID=3036245 RepID=A0ABQ6LMV0_9RHOB|nr:helix-turn-helix domain-containing protein [Limibaculum sp. NKW23]GMG84526.1 helix-turn-helix domain-containing protein [Limibaculum sp. NKW23]
MEFTPTFIPITRGVLAKRSGCNLETIRYYEKIALLPAPRRSAGGQRLYTDQDQRRLRFIMRARELGFSIDEIRSLLSMATAGTYTCAQIHGLTVAHLQDIRKKLADLARLERTLSEIADRCASDTAPDCPVIDALWEDQEQS